MFQIGRVFDGQAEAPFRHRDHMAERLGAGILIDGIGGDVLTLVGSGKSDKKRPVQYDQSGATK